MSKERFLICNKIQTPDGTILESKYTHDFVSHVDKNGETYILDGGLDYQRCSVNVEPFKDLSIYSDAPFEIIRENYKRGTFDEKGNRIWKPLNTLSDEHLKNILVYNKEIGLNNSLFSKMVRKEQKYRKDHNITIQDNYKK
jgi:hypothetical protein